MKTMYITAVALSLFLPLFAQAAADPVLESQRKLMLSNYEESLKDTQAVVDCIKSAKEISVMNNCQKILSDKAAARVKKAQEAAKSSGFVQPSGTPPPGPAPANGAPPASVPGDKKAGSDKKPADGKKKK